MSTDKRKRRLSGGVRKEHLGLNAFLFEFNQPDEPMDMFGREVSPSIRPAHLLSGKELQSARDQYRTMERKGFRVTKDTGCLIPHEQYCTYQQGSTLKGYHRAFMFFGRWRPAAGTLRNQFGWPMTPQISHLCHRRACCRIDHLVAEEQWRNLKRNYCGHDGVCDCSNEIKCIKRYTMSDQEEEPVFCTTEHEVRELLKGAPSYRILPANHFAGRDESAEQRKLNKAKRTRKQQAHNHQTARKQSRLASIAEESSESADDE
jgi:hypothetical protein